jgi:hypothetical protein
MKTPIEFSGRAVLGAALVSVLFAGSAHAQAAPPNVGDTFYFNCTVSGGYQYQETYKVTNAKQHMVRVEVDNGKSKNWYEKPYYFLPTTLMSREKIGNRLSTMSGIPDDFDGLKSMKVGDSFEGWLNEKRPNQRLNWSYKVAVVGSDRFYTKKYGDLDVVVVDEQRFAGLYSATLTSYYAPRMRFPVYWKYEDSNNSSVECRMDDAELAPALIASGEDGSGDGISRTSGSNTAIAMMTLANANVRAKPGVSADRVAVLPANTRVSVLGSATVEGEMWYQVGLEDGKTGFVYGPLLDTGASAAKVAAVTKPAPAPEMKPAPAAQPEPAVKTRAITASGPAAAKSVRLARLEGIYRDGLLSREEYDRKLAEIKGEKAVGTVAEQLAGINRDFRAGKLTPEEFIQERGKVLQTISPQTMAIKTGLVLLDQLIEKRLISQTEYGRKRQQMIDGI